MPTSLTIVVPIHNEAAFLPDAVPRLLEEMDAVSADITILLCENGSSDDTAAVARSLSETDSRLRVLQLADPDYGKAMRSGFLAADTDWVANFDIDYFSADFLRTAMGMAGEADIVLASKRVTGADDRRSFFRRMGTLGFNLLIRMMFGSGVSDTHGMKLVRGTVAAEITPRVVSNQDLFDTELVIRAERAGYRIREVPALVEELRETRSSFLGRVPRTLKGLWRIRKALRREARS